MAPHPLNGAHALDQAPSVACSLSNTRSEASRSFVRSPASRIQQKLSTGLNLRNPALGNANISSPVRLMGPD
jgi:hypothetical protein